jgi:hypothetical protein
VPLRVGRGQFVEVDRERNAGVVHDDIDAAERLDRGAHDRLCPLLIGDRMRVSLGVAARRPDLLGDLFGRGDAGIVGRLGTADIVDDHVGPARGEQESMCAPQAGIAAGSRDNRRSTVESKFPHATPLWSASRRWPFSYRVA